MRISKIHVIERFARSERTVRPSKADRSSLVRLPSAVRSALDVRKEKIPSPAPTDSLAHFFSASTLAFSSAALASAFFQSWLSAIYRQCFSGAQGYSTEFDAGRYGV